jgi:hypothetical protein
MGQWGMALTINGVKNGAAPNWAAILGRWDIAGANQTFLGIGMPTTARGQSFPFRFGGQQRRDAEWNVQR